MKANLQIEEKRKIKKRVQRKSGTFWDEQARVWLKEERQKQRNLSIMTVVMFLFWIMIFLSIYVLLIK
ncbi:MAG: hypothetical protein ACFFC1_13330 [Promethearchaeota archaeon]